MGTDDVGHVIRFDLTGRGEMDDKLATFALVHEARRQGSEMVRVLVREHGPRHGGRAAHRTAWSSVSAVAAV